MGGNHSKKWWKIGESLENVTMPADISRPLPPPSPRPFRHKKSCSGRKIKFSRCTSTRKSVCKWYKTLNTILRRVWRHSKNRKKLWFENFGFFFEKMKMLRFFFLKKYRKVKISFFDYFSFFYYFQSIFNLYSKWSKSRIRNCHFAWYLQSIATFSRENIFV